MRVVSTRVLPLPAPARINADCGGSSTAARCSGLRPESREGFMGELSHSNADFLKFPRGIQSLSHPLSNQEMRLDRLQRIYQLHRIIGSKRQPVPLRILQKELECSRATVHRIIQEMRLYFSAPIEYDRERNGYFYVTKKGETFELPGVWFNAAELYALLTTQQLLAQTQPGLLDQHLRPIKDRIEKILAAEQLGSGEIIKRVRILRMAGRDTSSEHFQAVAGALLQRQRLAIRYHGSARASARARIETFLSPCGVMGRRLTMRHHTLPAPVLITATIRIYV